MGPLYNIEVALQTRLASVEGHPNIVWENDDSYNPPLGQTFWRPRNLPFASVLSTADRAIKHSGIYQVDVFVPKHKGLRTLREDLDSIYTVFDSSDSIISENVTIEINAIGAGKVTIDKVWCSGFLEIYYYCYTRGN